MVQDFGFGFKGQRGPLIKSHASPAKIAPTDYPGIQIFMTWQLGACLHVVIASAPFHVVTN
jgi:hypothetical protein